MVRQVAVFTLVFTFASVWGLSESAGQDKDKKERTGVAIGELKSRKETNKGRNILLEILSAGEEKARVYYVAYDAKINGPNAEVLAAVNAAKIGDRVQCDWAYRGEGGFAVTAFQVLRKAEAKKDDGKEK